MKPSNVTSNPAYHFSRLHEHRPRLRRRLFRRGGNFWVRFFAVLLLGSLLLSPAGTIPAQAAFDAPILLRPDNMDIVTTDEAPPLGIPEFGWEPVSGASQYHLQVSTDIGFTITGIVIDILTTNTSYTPTIYINKLPDGIYYWHVRVEKPTAGYYNDMPWSFTKQWASPENAPLLTSPADGITLGFYNAPAFSWTPVIGAAKYKLQIYSSPGGWASQDYNATVLATTFQPTFKLPNGVYYWRVVPVDPGTTCGTSVCSHDGVPSEERSFTQNYNPALTLLAPDPNSLTYPVFTPTFRWTAVLGAEDYDLQYSTDPTFPNNTSLTTSILTANTAYTPTVTLPNDVNYYWRVRANSGYSTADWVTAPYPFMKKWYIKPVLLTPTNNYQHQRFPLFSWTPVPGAATYQVEVSLLPNFGTIFDNGTTANPFFTPKKYIAYQATKTTYYWRVTPIDGNGKAGMPSDTSSYASYGESVAPQQIYPLFYYPPDTYAGFPGITTNPHEDRTVPLPIFIWQRVFKPVTDPDEGNIYAAEYRLQVSTDPTFTSVNWTADTENTFVVPTIANPFTPLPNRDYFWRVCVLVGGTCDLSDDPAPVPLWSQIWKTRFDLTKGLSPTSGASPSLIRPTNGFEFAEATPLLEWFPMSGATSYEVQISQDSSFATFDTATVPYPAYIPTQSLAQRSLGAVDFGIYYWRVRKSGGSWSETRRFQIAAQTQWTTTRTLGDAANRLQIGSDPPVGPGEATTDPDYDLTDLQVTQSISTWYFGFHVPATPGKAVTYALYLDLDHQDASGATVDARGYTVSTISGYRPEYALYVMRDSLGAVSTSTAYLYHWIGSGWDTVQVFNVIGGELNLTGDYLEIGLPNTAINYQDTNGSYAISLLSLPAGDSGTPKDSVPSDPNVPGSSPISRFANVTERLNLIFPPNNAGVDPTAYPSLLPFTWDWPVLAHWSGANLEAATDVGFTHVVASSIVEVKSNNAYYVQSFHAYDFDFEGNNTYYWHVQPKYRDEGCALCLGVWSQAYRLERRGFVAQNLKTSVTFATPTFSWDLVEGAQFYDLQVDEDPNFAGSLSISLSTRQNSYTDLKTLGDGVYYWRVRVHRYNGIIEDWTQNQVFTLTRPVPINLTHSPSGTVDRSPTLCWTPVVVNAPSTTTPVMAAWRYYVQISSSPTFTPVTDYATTEQSCWTPAKGLADNDYYWRVYMVDKYNHGNYSATATLKKQYHTTTLIAPLNSTVAGTPTFIWTPVQGAATYRLEISLNDTFSPIYSSQAISTNNVRYTPVITFAPNKTYYWRVAMVDGNSPTPNAGPWTTSTIILSPYPFGIYLPLLMR